MARAQVPKAIPFDILLYATGPLRQNTNIENLSMILLVITMFQTMYRHQVLYLDALRIGSKCSAINLSRSEFEIYTFSTKHELSESAVDDFLEIVSNVSSALAILDTWHVIYRLVLLAGRI